MRWWDDDKTVSGRLNRCVLYEYTGFAGVVGVVEVVVVVVAVVGTVVAVGCVALMSTTLIELVSIVCTCSPLEIACVFVLEGILHTLEHSSDGGDDSLTEFILASQIKYTPDDYKMKR